MKIKSMTASFGKLNKVKLELESGLNLIEGHNEAGKSTWCAFIRAMLYGIPTRERDKQGYIAEKNRFQPWSGSPMEGEMILSWQGRDITIRRGPKGAAPFADFSAVYMDTQEPVPGLTAANCGETMLGVSREVFERSAFVGQGGAGITADAELERRIAALVSSGEEDVSFSQVEGRLREWHRRRKYNKSGLIPKLEGELAAVSDTLARQDQVRARAEEARQILSDLSQRKRKLVEALEAHRRAENRLRHRRYQAAQEALQAAQADLRALSAVAARTPDSAVLRDAQGDLAYYNTLEANRRMAEGEIAPAEKKAEALAARVEQDRFYGMTADQAWQQASMDRDRAAAKRPQNGALWTVLVLLVGVALGVILFLNMGLGIWVYTAVGVAVALALVINIVSALRIKTWRKETAAILAQYDVPFPDDILAQANDYREKQVAAQEAVRALEAVQNSVTQIGAQKEEILSQLLELVHQFEPGVTDLFGVSAAISRGLSVREKLNAAQVRLEGARALAESLPQPQEPIDEGLGDEPIIPPDGPSPQQLAAQLAAVEGELGRVSNDLALATGELNTLGDGLALNARREEIEEELVRRRREHDALTLALECLDDANTSLRSRFSPALNASAGEILSALTGGKYRRVGLDRQFEAQAQETGALMPRSTLALSKGTAEQVYLAVRLGVCGLVLPGDDPAPIVLDDALDAFDDTRMALALDYLLKLGEERQILLFTCHSREGKYLRAKGADTGVHILA